MTFWERRADEWEKDPGSIFLLAAIVIGVVVMLWNQMRDQAWPKAAVTSRPRRASVTCPGMRRASELSR